MSNLAGKIFGLLREMDREAALTKGGEPTGLNWYGGYARPELVRPQTEPCWTVHLAKRLNQLGCAATAEKPYPDLPAKRTNRCDLVISMLDGQSLWLEIKGAWKAYWRNRGKDGIYRSYLLHPLEPGLDNKSHTVPKDVEKLKRLKRPDATQIGILLIGFDSDACRMDDDIARLTNLVGFSEPPWKLAYDQWQDRYRAGETVRCWLWRSTISA